VPCPAAGGPATGLALTAWTIGISRAPDIAKAHKLKLEAPGSERLRPEEPPDWDGPLKTQLR
jgi:hypothetical protein